MPTLILICGLPGAGKTTLARRLEGTRRAVRLCPDEWLTALGVDLHLAGEPIPPATQPFRDRLEATLTRHASALLRGGHNVILEYGFWARSERAAHRHLARALGARVELHTLILPIDTLWERLVARNTRAPWGTATVTRDQLESWSRLFEAPDDVEVTEFDRHESESCTGMRNHPD